MIKMSKNTIIDLLFLLVLSVIPFVFYGYNLIMFSQAEAFVDPLDALHRWSYLWDSRVFLGGDIGYAMGGAFPLYTFFGFFSVLNVPLFVIDKLWFTFLLFLSGSSMYLLVSVVINKVHHLAKVGAAIAYMYSLYVIITLHGTSQFLPFYGVLPAMLALYIRSLNGHLSIKSALLLALLSTLMSGINPSMVIINFLVLLAYLVFHLAVNGLKDIKRIVFFNFVAIFAYVGLNFYWIYPMVRYNFTAWMAPVFSETLGMHNASSSFFEIFRTLGYWGFYSGYNGVPYFSFSGPYIYNPLLILTTTLLPIFAVTTILLKPRSKYELFFVVLIVLCIPMAVATYPNQNPSLIGKAYLWAYENIPFFNIFRNNYKLVMPITLAFCALLGFLLHKLCAMNFNGKSRIRFFFVISIIAMLFINSWPLYTGNEFSANMQTREIPQYWYDASNWLNSLEGDGGLFILPSQYGSVYSWSKSVGYLNIPMFKRPQVFQQMGVGATTQYSADFLALSYKAFERNSTNFCKILGFLGVQYLMQRNDVDWQYYGVTSPSQVKEALRNQHGVTFECSFGELDFYRNEYYVPRVYAADNVVYVNSNVDSLQTSNFLSTINLNRSVLFFSDLPQTQDNQTGKYANKYVSLLENYGDVPAYFTSFPWRGKLYDEGAKGTMSTLKVYVKNINTTNDSYINMGFAEVPGATEIFNVNVTVPKGYTGWLYQEIDRSWDFDSIFVYSNGGPSVNVGLDLLPPYDCYNSNLDNRHWYNASERYFFGLEYQSTELSKSEAICNNSPVPTLTYESINPTEFLVSVNSQKPFFLVFLQSYDSQWTAYADGKALPEHFIGNGYANSWYVNKTGHFTITLRYSPQALYDLSKVVTVISFVTVIIFTIFSSAKIRRSFKIKLPLGGSSVHDLTKLVIVSKQVLVFSSSCAAKKHCQKQVYLLILYLSCKIKSLVSIKKVRLKQIYSNRIRQNL